MSLTSTPRTHNRGDRVYDTWEIKNDTQNVVRLLSVAVAGAHTYDDTTGRIQTVPLPVDDDGAESGVTLRFDNDSLQAELSRHDTWSGVSLPPGTTMQATVLNNRELRITYNTNDDPETTQIVVQGNV